MVEGPGCKLKGENLRRRARGQKVEAVSGTAVEKRVKAAVNGSSPFDVLVGMKLMDVNTLGKELFAHFEDDACLRVHFLMAGSVRFNKEPHEFGRSKTENPVLVLKLTKDEVYFLGTSVELRSSADCLQKYTELIDLDICSPTFDAKRATRTIMEHSERLICDVILDQLVLPGVGNIIKNEALFNAGINPNSRVSELSQELVSLLVKMNRDFTMIFYKCRKEGKNLHKFMNVYKKGKCVECGGQLIKCKIGEYDRLTFFCQACQTNTLKSCKKFPTKNSLLGWVLSSNDQVPWICSVCTLENKPANSKCMVCLTARTPSLSDLPHHLTISDHTLESSLESPNSSSQFLVPSTPPSSSSSATPRSNFPTQGDKRLLDTVEETSRSVKGKYTFRRLTGSQEIKASPAPSHKQNSMIFPSATRSENQLRVDVMKLPKVTPPNTRPADNSGKTQVFCSGHKAAARRCRVVKENENRGRIFYTCNMPMKTKCQFFMWGDLHHPLCHHGKISIIRTVLKQTDNNGRDFYCCPLPKSKQCDFFQWLDNK
ncbi:endonuclease 8-like 3 isoform X2 [Homarus americanus]|nr:endonuclease 8-like 3 isoform X2 [Homarus americanus]XP_042204488.1 endonuclease 8-like 3 isoform X2 [Homarus americanus]XP_042204489.1 endonuclease 8-like 3 isoform X2 [Homarus americanus]XP_042204490.1 endonuclease 8-like 3 isoform X2 [Homarus americanus]XP_042204491.1 endonuclease 8-like 3 isoform X2 [Homarus americanus]XP_042204493.1 endonuclease 8-like 3 isoform X2 [Homarus americanus]XP_042204494.1 endonuclease 8-like 3 isoform X2 [Homarus americanus]XP_042204495.1 endonuclease 8-li